MPVVLAGSTFPQGYVMTFTIAAILVFISWVFLSLTREPAVYSSKPPVSQLTLPLLARSAAPGS